MTTLSLKELADFLSEFHTAIKYPIANYGGGLYKVDLVKEMLDAGGLTGEYDVLDYDTGVDLMLPLKKKYGLGICMDLLEHTKQPFIVAKNIYNSLQMNALLFVTVPFIWEVHSYPGDYWRFTVDGIMELFPKMTPLYGAYVRDQHTDPEPCPRTRVVVGLQKKKLKK